MKSWNDITFKEYIEYSSILTDENLKLADKMTSLLSLDRGKPVEFDENTDIEFARKFSWMFKTPPSLPYSAIRKIVEEDYKWEAPNADMMRVSQWIDFSIITKNEVYKEHEKLEKLLSVFGVTDYTDKPALIVVNYIKEWANQIRLISETFPLIFSSSASDSKPSYESSGLNDYGIIPFVFRICEKANEPYETVLGWKVVLFFYLTNYLILESKEQEKQAKMWQAKHR